MAQLLFFMNVMQFLFGSWYTMINFSLQDSELTRVGSGNLLEQIITEDIGLGYLFSAITPLSPFLSKKKEKKIQGSFHSSVNTFCFADVHQYPFLYSRIFSSVAKFSSVVTIAIFPYLF